MIPSLVFVYLSLTNAQVGSNFKAQGTHSLLAKYGLVGNSLSVGEVDYGNQLGANAEFGEESNLFNDTDKLMKMLNKEKNMLAQVVKDNENIEKYIYSVIQYFYLKFMNVFINSKAKNITKKDINDELYNHAFDTALLKTKDNKNKDAIQFAAPVHRISVIFNSLIDTLVEIVQTTCTPASKNWECGATYYTMLASETFNCKNMWYHHHEVFVESLNLVQKAKKTLQDVTMQVMGTIKFMITDFSKTILSKSSMSSQLNFEGSAGSSLRGKIPVLGGVKLFASNLKYSVPLFTSTESSVKHPFNLLKSPATYNRRRFNAQMRRLNHLVFNNQGDAVSDVEVKEIDEFQSHLFDVIMKYLGIFREVLNPHLVARARIYKLVVDGQRRDQLDCLEINRELAP